MSFSVIPQAEGFRTNVSAKYSERNRLGTYKDLKFSLLLGECLVLWWHASSHQWFGVNVGRI